MSTIEISFSQPILFPNIEIGYKWQSLNLTKPSKDDELWTSHTKITNSHSNIFHHDFQHYPSTETLLTYKFLCLLDIGVIKKLKL